MAKKLTLTEQWERFWSRVEKTDGCWFWTGGTNNGGYGSMQYAGRICGAHRLMLHWFGRLESPMYKGDMKSGFVLHACDNPRCVNPAHLSVGTSSKNAQEAIDRGLSVRESGEKHPRALFTNTQVAWMREEVRAGRARQVDIARKFGVSRTVINWVIHNKVYKDV